MCLRINKQNKYNKPSYDCIYLQSAKNENGQHHQFLTLFHSSPSSSYFYTPFRLLQSAGQRNNISISNSFSRCVISTGAFVFGNISKRRDENFSIHTDTLYISSLLCVCLCGWATSNSVSSSITARPSGGLFKKNKIK